MKRIVLIIGALLLGLTVRAQSVTYTCRYWFDQNFAQATATTFSASTWQAELDVGSLTEGLHALHLHVMDTSIKWSAPQSYLFLKLTPPATSTDFTYYYWFDQDHASTQSGALGDGHLLLDVDDLSEGLHAIHVMLKGGEYSASQTYLFFKADAWESGTPNYVYHCWFDEDFANQQTDALGRGHLLLDVVGLEDGMHTVHVLVEGSTLTSTQSYLFMKVAPFAADSIDMDHLAYHCWFDQDFEHQQIDSLGDGHLLLDVNDLEDGLHTVHVMLQGSTLTATQSYMFMKMAVEDPSAELQYICWFDQNYSSAQTGPLGSGLFELEVGDLPNGIHTVNVQLDNGTRTAPQCYLFYKQPLGGYGIARWEYWLNDDIANRQITNISPSIDTLDIVSLLNVGHPALRSSCFHFHPNGDAPYINAKNQINFRFYDSELRIIDKSAYYVDEQVEQNIVANVFERNTTETFAAPRNNQITWYKLEAGVGDSLAFEADKACTMQLFAPSGEEVYSVTASEAMAFGGCHAWEDGYYYLAVHDVTGSGETVSTTYQHFDKYVVLSYSPNKVGNRVGNRFLIDLIGNGFDYLENAMFIRENDTVLLNQIIVSSRTKPSLQFVISDIVANGKYDFLLTFRNGEEIETLLYAETLELEEPDSGERIVTITTPAANANPYPVRVTVENTSNMDYVYVPFNIAFTWPTNLYPIEENRIDRIDFADFCATMTYAADSLGYNFVVMTDNLLGMQKEGGVLFMGIPYLKAHETKTYTLNFTSPAHIMFDLYAWTGEGYEYNADFDTLLISNRNGKMSEDQNLIDFIELAWEIDGRLIRPEVAAGFEEENNRGRSDEIRKIKTVRKGSVGNAFLAANESGDIWGMMEASNSTYGTMYDIGTKEKIDSIKEKQKKAAKKPNPNPGNPCHVYLCHPHDPNDIYGYLSESGSHYMRQEIQNVQYEIEFENDTTLATAAAHTIIVRDTLDAAKFDLNSLAARSVTIGEKRLELNGEQTFAQTLDMRPELYVIAQIEQDYDPTTGIIQWTIQSLDPMTMEPTDDPNQGVLPVNYYGNGVGFIDYTINLLESFDDGTEISNRAGIIFDQEDQILTPVWTNTIDAVKPTSQIESVEVVNDSLSFNFVSSDNRSGVWYHTLYYRNNSTEQEWQVRKPQIFGNDFMLPFDSLQTTEYFVMAVDSAGNVEEMKTEAEVIVEGSATGFPLFVAGYGAGSGKWHLIASPLADAVNASDVINLTANTFDLYRFNPNAAEEWENWKQEGDHYHFTLESGQGYLYANSADVTLVFVGTPYDGNGEVELTYDANDDHKCWNLVGNPFNVAATLDRQYYVLKADGTGIDPNPIQADTPIPPCTAVFVKAVAEGETVVFTRVAP